MTSLNKSFLFLFIILFPFTSWFALNDLLRLPVLLAVLISISLFIQIVKKRNHLKFLFKINGTEFLFLVFIVVSLVSYINNYSRSNLNYLIAFIFIFFCYLYVLRRLLIINDVKREYIVKAFYASTFVLLSVIYIEFIFLNLFGFSIRPLFMISEEAYNMIFYVRGNGLFLSGGGGAEEPGAMAAFLNVVAPIGVYYSIEIKKSYKLLFFYLVALIMLFSTAGLITLLISTIFLILYLRSWKLLVASFVIVLCTVFIIFQTNLISGLIDRILLDPEAVSSFHRVTAWDLAITNFVEAPILGNGPGYATKAYEMGYMSVYLTVLSDIGVIAFIVFSSIVILTFRKIFKIKGALKYYLLISFSTVCIHYSIMSNFYHAHFWLMIVVINYLAYNENNPNKKIIFINANKHNYSLLQQW